MRFPDAVTILRASAADEYGNPGADWSDPSEIAATAFVSGDRSRAMFPATTDVRTGDRLRWGSDTYDLPEVSEARSPSRVVFKRAKLRQREA